MIRNSDLALPLCNELEAWCEIEKLPYIRADDIAALPYLSQLQKSWIAAFRVRWDSVKTMELAAQIDPSAVHNSPRNSQKCQTPISRLSLSQ